MTPDDYFAAIEERQVRGSASLSVYYGLNVRQMTPEEATYAASHHELSRTYKHGARKERKHGTASRYKAGCRCDACRRAKSEYARDYRARKAAEEGVK